MRSLFVLAAILSAIPLAAEAQERDRDDPLIEITVVGTYHFDNPGLDTHNAVSDDVTKPHRQRELAILADTLAEFFQPTKVAIEEVAGEDSLIHYGFRDYTPELAADMPPERIQIGMRTAFAAGAPVYAVDELPSDGEPDYFPIDAFRESIDTPKERAEYEQNLAEGEARQARKQGWIDTQTIPGVLARMNDKRRIDEAHASYLMMNVIGDTQDQKGAELYAYWMMRNAKIFAKIEEIAEPGDRILVVFGSGHAYWLRHFAQETPGFRHLDPAPLLKIADLAVKVERAEQAAQ